jgi:hypothetical protein
MENERKHEQPAPGTLRNEKKPYVGPSLRRLGSVRELTGGGPSPTHTDGLNMMAM